MLNETMLERFKGSSLLLIRLSLVAIFLYHGFPKAVDWPMAYGKFEAMGFPGFLGPTIGIVEVLAALLLLMGYWNFQANLVLAAIIFVAIIGVQIPGAEKAGKLLTAGLERDLLILMGNFILMAFGPGVFAIDSTERDPVRAKSELESSAS